MSNFYTNNLKEVDSEVFLSLSNELHRQQNVIELIASENLPSLAVLNAQGSIMTNKYAEGYPRKRYYGGCEFVDKAEELALERVKKLFNCKFANVQPHSGSQANQAVLLALIQPNDTVLGMSLASWILLSNVFNAFCIFISVKVSTFAVASSSISISGSANNTLAKLINCLCPKLRFMPRS